MRSRHIEARRGYLNYVNKPTNSKPKYDTREILELAIAVDRKQGFIKSGYGYTITNDDDGKYLPEEEHTVMEDNKTVIHKHLKGEKKIHVTANDKELAGEITAHFRGLALKKLSGNTNDFQNSVLMYLDAEKVDNLGLAIIASLPSGFKRDIKRQELNEETVDSEYVGTLRERGKFTVEVKDTRSFPYGELVTCVESKKNVVKFFFANDLKMNGIEVGKVLNIAGFVKNQEVSKYSKLKETMLNRVKVEK